ncbi:hypothetical protein F5146DRAFT_1133799 [Armillaria mellea]|nr:hypothetical protein F5146DRAFT_1133799 [Armillaria mellea]
MAVRSDHRTAKAGWAFVVKDETVAPLFTTTMVTSLKSAAIFFSSNVLSYLALVASFFALSSAQFGPYYSLGATSSYIIDGGGWYQSIVPAVYECSASTGQWCAFASVYDERRFSLYDANTPVTINYKYDESTESVTVNGELISTITTCPPVSSVVPLHPHSD